MAFAARRQEYMERTEERGAAVQPVSAPLPLEVVMTKPAQYEDVSRVAGLCADNRLVVVNLEELPQAAARRIVDFLSGVAYGRHASLERLSRGSYAVVPVGAELLDRRMDEPDDEWDRYF